MGKTITMSLEEYTSEIKDLETKIKHLEQYVGIYQEGAYKLHRDIRLEKKITNISNYFNGFITKDNMRLILTRSL